MSFLLNEEQRQFSDSAQEFLSAKSPLSLQRQLRDTSSALGFEPRLWEEVIELGWPAAVLLATKAWAQCLRPLDGMLPPCPYFRPSF